MILLLLGCAPTGCSAHETDDVQTSPDHGLVVATSDFSVGALATVDLTGQTLRDAIVATSGDTVVTSDHGLVLQIDRSPPAGVRAWAPPDWSAPVAEYAIPGDSNPQDAAVCGSRVFVSLLAEPRIAVFDLDGSEAGSIDLSAFADDANPEAASLAHAGDRLFVGLQQLDTQGPLWTPSGPGVIVEIDCGTLATTSSWEVGPNPSLHELAADALLIRTGTYGVADGALTVLHVDDVLGTPLLTEALLGEDLGDVTVVGGFAVVLTAAMDFSHHTVRCLDLSDGSQTASEPIPNYLSGVAAGGDGLAWIAQSVDYANAASPTGLLAVDPTTCTAASDGVLKTLLPPYALASY